MYQGKYSSLEQYYDEIQADITIGDEREKELRGKYIDSRETIARITASGSYIVSEDTIKALRSLLNQLTNSELEIDFQKIISDNYNAVLTCIPIVREEAKKHCAKGID